MIQCYDVGPKRYMYNLNTLFITNTIDQSLFLQSGKVWEKNLYFLDKKSLLYVYLIVCVAIENEDK